MVNRTARLYSRRPALLVETERVCGDRARVHVTSSLRELDEVAGDIAARGTDVVVVAGGDGSAMAGVSALHRAFAGRPLPALLLLAGGTAATVAKNFGAGGDPVRRLDSLLSAPDSWASEPRATLHVRASLGVRREERVGFIFGTGLVASFFDVYYERGANGYRTAAAIVARVFVESFFGGPLARRILEPLPCRIFVDGRALRPEAWSLVCASVVRDLGLHMHVTYRAGEDARRPHLVASPLAPGKLGPRAPLVLAGQRIGGDEHFDGLVGTFTVRFRGNGPYVLDGDTLRADEIEVRAGPVIEVLRPPAAG